MKQTNLYLDDDAAATLDRLAKEEGVNKKDIVQKALEQYDTDSWESRMERKIDRIENAVGEGDGPSDDSAEKKEKTEDDESASITEKRADNMVDHLLTEIVDGDDVFPNAQIDAAIEEIWSDTEYALEEYRPRVKARLRDAGWRYFESRDIWCATDEVYSRQLKQAYSFHREQIFDDEAPKDEIDDAVTQLSRYTDEFVENGVADEEEVEEVVSAGASQLGGLSGDLGYDRRGAQ